MVVVLDGFDPGEGTEGGNDILGIYNDFNSFELSDSLRIRNGFDIVPLNFKKQVYFNYSNILFPTVINGGTDYIERNAMVLVTLLEKLNGCKTGNNPIKVVGFSMGGVIARYALAYMEQENIPHNVDLFVSIDSPHQGAIVPKGLQDIADLVNDLSLGIADNPLDLLESPAAKQLLKHHINSNSVLPAGAPNFHERFFNQLNLMGYPQDSRNISIIDGTLDGSSTNDFGEQYVNLNARAILGILKTDLKLNYSPTPGNTINDLYFRFYLRFPLFKITIFKRKRSISSLSSLGSLENSPGGYYDVDNMADKFLGGNFYGIFGNTSGTVLENFLRDVFLYIDLSLTDPNFSFVPTKSSLDFIGNPYLYEKLDDRDLTCSGETPFDTYYAPTKNEKHISLGEGASDFILSEILGNKQKPNINLDSSENLSGPNRICDQPVQYTMNACAGSVSNWSVSQNLNIESSTPYTVTISKKYSTPEGKGYITASNSSGGGSTKEIFVGAPNIYTLNNDGSKNYMGTSFSYPVFYGSRSIKVYSDETNATFSWDLFPSDIQWTSHNNRITFNGNQAGVYWATVTTQNACDQRHLFFSINIGNNNNFMVYPNPAPETINIQAATNRAEISSKNLSHTLQNKSSQNQKFKGELYDFNAIFIKSIQLDSSGTVQLDVSNLKEGIYFLKITGLKQEEVHKIIVKH